MVHINSEGKFNDNSYLIDAFFMRLKGTQSNYVIENDDVRMMIDITADFAVRKVLKKLKEFGLFPIHKLLLTHSHWDHVQGVEKLKKLNGDFEVLASEKAIDNLKYPEKMNKCYDFDVKPIENVTPLKEGDLIDMNGLKLEIFNFFGHTMDSIAIFDKKNKNIFTGDAIIDRLDYETFNGTFWPPDFHEAELLKTFQKLRKMRDNLNSISLAHYGVWKDEDLNKILDEMEDLHLKTKDAIIRWYNENPSLEYITLKYHEAFTPDTKIFTKENIHGLEWIISWLVEGLKTSGYIR